MIPCSSCGSPLSLDQRYCIECGTRRVGMRLPWPPRVAASAAQRGLARLPTPSSAAALSAVVLGTGVLMGAAVGPALTGESSASPAIRALLMPDRGGSSDSPSTSSGSGLEQPVADVASSPSPATPAPARTAARAPAPAPADNGSSPSSDAPASPEPPAADETTSVTGVVAHLNKLSHSYALATSSGELIAVHAAKLPVPGQRLKASVRQLANGTFGQAKVTRGGERPSVKFRGTVTFRDPARGLYTVSVLGASVLVRGPAPAPGAAAPAPPPALGALVTTTAAIVQVPDPTPKTSQHYELHQRELKLTGIATGPIDLEAVVEAVDLSARTVTLSADDARESERKLVMRTDPKLGLEKLSPPDQVLAASVTLGPDGSYTLAGFGDDSSGRLAASGG